MGTRLDRFCEFQEQRRPSERVDEGDGRATYGDSYTRMELTIGLKDSILNEQGLMSKLAQRSSAREEMPLGR